MQLPAYATKILHDLNRNGFEAYAVGGAVRDFLLGVTPDDIDITTNASPTQIMQVFADHTLIPTGLKHGTVTVLVDGTPCEITTYRTDGNYSDGRHPDSVSFTSSLTEDLARRDFTINAMAYHPACGVVDPFGGQEDLLHQRLRCVGDPSRRFTEDALRIARLIRFMSVLDFDAEEHTLLAAEALCSRLEAVAAERKRVELVKCLLGKGFFKTAMRCPAVMTQLVPALAPCVGFDQHNPHHDFDIYEHTVRAVAHAPTDTVVRLAALFHDVGKPACFTTDEHGIGHFYGHAAISHALAEEALHALRFDNATIRAVLPLVKHHDTTLTDDRRLLRRRLHRFGPDGLERLLAVKEADAAACHDIPSVPDFREIRAVIRDILEAQDCLTLKDLAVDGDDLLAQGYPKGPQIGAILKSLLNSVLTEELPNDRACLIEYVKERWPL